MQLLLSQFLLYLMITLVGIGIWIEVSIHSLESYGRNIQPQEMARLDKQLKKGNYDSPFFRPYNSYGAFFEIFSYEDGLIYSSNPEVQYNLTTSELDLILPHDADYYYTSMQYISPESGQFRYLVQKNKGSSGRFVSGGIPFEDEEFAYLLDADMNIIFSAMPTDRQRFSSREIQIMTQSLGDNYHLYRYNFETDTGEKMAFVIFKPYDDSQESQAFRDQVIRNVILLILVFGLFIILFAWRLHRKISRPLAILKGAIVKLANRDKIEAEETSAGPQEFMEIFDTFNAVSTELYESEMKRMELEESKQKMLANISHDLRTPITVIQGYSKALLDHLTTDEMREQYMQIIYQKSIVLNELINSLYDFSRIQHPNFNLVTKKEDFGEYLRHYWARRYDEFSVQDYQLDIDIAEERCFVDLDVAQFNRVLDNLINNFIRYNPPGTLLHFKMVIEKDHVIVTIADDGEEIPEEIAGTIFRPFVTGSEARTSGAGGTGLGLAIVQQFVEMHQGNIILDTNVASYTKAFVITLPLSQ